MNNEAPKGGGKRRLRKILYVYIAVILALIFCSKTIYTYSLPKVSVVMPGTGRLNKEVEARGVIGFAKTIDICADNPGRIDEILIHEGDVVTAGMAIARLTAPKPDDAAIYRISNRLAGLNLSKSDISGRLSALEADPSELVSYETAIADAKTALGRAQAEYDEAARAFLDSGGDSADYAQAVADAERELRRRKTELKNADDELARIESDNGENLDGHEDLPAIETAAAEAKTALDRAQAEYEEATRAFRDAYGDSADNVQAVADAGRELDGRETELQNARDELARIESDNGKSFDDYEYALAIETAAINLERRRNDLEKAEDAVDDAKSSSENFDDYEYRKAVNSAMSESGRSEDLYKDADENYSKAQNHYYDVLSHGGDDGEIALALQEMNAALSARRDARWDADAAKDALRNAMEDMERAKESFLSDSASLKEQAVKKAEADADLAGNAVADAERELEEAKEALRRAELAHSDQQDENRENELEAARQKLTAAEAAVGDAEYIYGNAVSGLSRAAKESAEDKLYEFEAAGRKLLDAETALDRANRSLETAAAKQLENIEEERKDYNLQLESLEFDIELAEIDMLEARPPKESMESLNKLTSFYGGIVISVDKKIGQYASPGERVAVAGDLDGGFVCEVTIPENDARFIEVGDTAVVRRSGSGNTADASVTAVTLEGDTLRVKLTVLGEGMNDGDYVSVKFAKQSVEFETIVPTEAVVSDQSKSYVWVLASKEGALGMEYYTRKVHVFIADKDGFYTAISTGLENYQPVVLSYDKEPVVNGRVSRME